MYIFTKLPTMYSFVLLEAKSPSIPPKSQISRLPHDLILTFLATEKGQKTTTTTSVLN